MSVRPFHCGSQFVDWQDRNCYNCSKFEYEPESFPLPCEIDEALLEALMGDGSINEDIAERMGYANNREYTWACPELEEKSKDEDISEEEE